MVDYVVWCVSFGVMGLQFWLTASRIVALKSHIDELWERNAEDRKLIGELRERVEELESSTNTTLHCPEVVDIFTTCLVPDTDWAADKPTEY